MSKIPAITFTTAVTPTKGRLILLAGKDGALGEAGGALDSDGLLTNAMKAVEFEGGFGKSIDIITPAGTGLDRITLLGVGDESKLDEHSWWKLGGKLSDKLSAKTRTSLILQLPSGETVSARQATAVAAAAQLSAYNFDVYKTKDDKEKKGKRTSELAIHVKSPAPPRSSGRDSLVSFRV